MKLTAKTIAVISMAITATVTGAIIAAFLLAEKAPATRPMHFILAVAMTLVSFGAAILFVMGWGRFKHRLRQALGFTCIGIILYTLGQLEFPLLELFHQEDSFVVRYGLVILPSIFCVVFVFLGARRFARLVQVRTVWSSAPRAFLTAWVLAFLAALLPHVPAVSVPDAAQRTWVAFIVFTGVIIFFATMTLARIRLIVSPLYSASLSWLVAGYGVLVTSSVASMFMFLYAFDSWYATSGLPLIPSLIATILLFVSGYKFAVINAAGPSVRAATATPVDVLTYVAGLASIPQEIDPMLNTLREITAHKHDDQLSNTDESNLAKLYEQLEDYLVNHEPLQKFSQGGLREDIRVRFQPGLGHTSPFWQLFD